MEREIRDELEVPGHVVMFGIKTKEDWIAQANKAMDDAEAYGAKSPNEMRDKEKDVLREALKALGINCNF